ncbi:glycosyltransferase [Paenibacillus ehimensis]|uniref:Glycosyltransferase n=1 Tax=Paenibacillus ehimensis TaxID=79264 RepID=A0ABT8VH72_9BACL|nr:glycosyltransferase [Paenibacillus ehimensis]MDO3680296.1 glycosyltransferase [Paenibacillus ehimensis]
MTQIDILLKKSISTIKYDGVGSFIKKSFDYTKRKALRKKIHIQCYKDILFINGCTLPHPTRYRVDHQIEQLHFNGYSCDVVYYENLELEMVKYYRGFVFFRCPYTDIIGDFIERAKYFNKKVFFDIDDLVIDYKYVKDIKYLETMTRRDYEMYMDGVERTKKTLSLCDYAITTTSRLANELSSYVPTVFINRNVASEKMVELSQLALKAKEEEKNNDKIILGYFSGSITHNDDFNMILPVMKNVLKKYSNVYLKIVGILDVPSEFVEFKEKIITEKFMDWTKLPELIAGVDINLAPLEESIFNEAKSENKWVEAALVKVPTIASNVGAFAELIKHGENGVLCNSVEEWEMYLEKLIEEEQYRNNIGNKAFQFVMENCITSYTGYKLFDFLHSVLSENIAFVLPSTQISGGVNVVIKHCNILRDAGKDVTIISMNEDHSNLKNMDGEINVVSYHRTSFHVSFDNCVATLWSTVDFINKYPKIRNKFYLVQNFETNFYEYGHIFRVWANLTYNSFNDLQYITISKWCEDWLKNKFNKNSGFARNGIDLGLFKYVERDFNGKIRILVEGNSNDHYKNVDESFKITNQLDRNKFEIWYLSYNGKPKEWYKIDRFFHKVPYQEVCQTYQDCHILLKSSILESFSYPPLEMMATGGIAVVSPNGGNVEYLKDKENCLLYEQGNINQAIQLIKEICENEILRRKLIINGLDTAKSRDWKLITNEILELYQMNPDQNSLREGGKVFENQKC